MTDLRKDNGSKTAAFSSAADLGRRRDWPARRRYRASSLLPVAPGGAGRLSHAVADVDWPEGASITRADEWQDKVDPHELGKDFAPTADQRPWCLAGAESQPPRAPGTLKVASFLSVIFHLGIAALLVSLPPADQVEIAGGGDVTVMLVGENAFDALAAGTPDASEKTVPAEEIQATKADEPPAEATTTEAVAADDPPPQESSPDVKPVAAEPSEERAADPVNEIASATSEVVSSTNEILAVNPERVSETGELSAAPAKTLDMAKPAETPVETAPPIDAKAVTSDAEMEPLPEPMQKETADTKPQDFVPEKSVTPVPRPAVQEPVKTKETTKRKKADPPARRSAKAHGQAGDSSANAQRGASANAGRSSSAEPGNAAVSNYPGKVATKLRRALKYPRGAVSHSRGEAQVAFTVQADGSASGIRLVASSGSTVLDQAALDAVRRASPFPPIPDGAGRRQWPFVVPVLFRR